MPADTRTQARTRSRSWSALAVVTGRGQGQPLLLDEPLSFWGGYDAERGRIIETGHAQHGLSLGGRVLLMARAKGSSSSSSVLAEAIRNGTGPAAIVMRAPDLIVGLGSIVASELYGQHVPVLVVSQAQWRALASVCIAADVGLLVDASDTGAGTIRTVSLHSG